MSRLQPAGRVLEDDWRQTRQGGTTAGGPRRLKTVVNTVKNLLSVSRDAKNWQEQIKKTQVSILHVAMSPISFHRIMVPESIHTWKLASRYVISFSADACKTLNLFPTTLFSELTHPDPLRFTLHYILLHSTLCSACSADSVGTMPKSFLCLTALPVSLSRGVERKFIKSALSPVRILVSGLGSSVEVQILPSTNGIEF